MKACNVLYQFHLYFGGSLSLTDSFQNLPKTRINCTKLHIQCPKIVCGGGRKSGGGRRPENGGSAMVVGGIDAPGDKGYKKIQPIYGRILEALAPAPF